MKDQEKMIEVLDEISNIVIKKEIETEENEEMKQLYDETLALESKVNGYIENDEFIKDKENISKIMTVSMICSRIENSIRKVVQKDMFNRFKDKFNGGDEDGE